MQVDFVFVVLNLLVFKVCGVIGILKINFFNFFDTERIKLINLQKKH